MNVFEELLEKTTGYPPEQMQDLRSMAETLQAIGKLASFDIVDETQYVLEHLPELREERAKQIRLAAKDRRADMTKEERERDLALANRLEKAAEKLKLPNVDEQFKRRAALTELSIRMKARIRDVANRTPELDPERLARFKTALTTITKSLPDEVGSQADREMMARIAFVQELRAAGGDVDLAVDNFYKAAFEDAERGHWGDSGLVVDGPGAESGHPAIPQDAHTQSVLQTLLDRQDEQEHQKRVAENKILQNMPKLAAEYLKPNEYAAYRVMIDNEHLLDWKIEKGKVQFKARTLDASDPENTIGKILQRDLNYQNIRGANMLIENTVSRLNQVLRERGDQEVVLSDKAAERMRKSTAQIVADPAAQAKRRKGPEL